MRLLLLLLLVRAGKRGMYVDISDVWYVRRRLLGLEMLNGRADGSKKSEAPVRCVCVVNQMSP